MAEHDCRGVLVESVLRLRRCGINRIRRISTYIQGVGEDRGKIHMVLRVAEAKQIKRSFVQICVRRYFIEKLYAFLSFH